jgi:hypothetical protein
MRIRFRTTRRESFVSVPTSSRRDLEVITKQRTVFLAFVEFKLATDVVQKLVRQAITKFLSSSIAASICLRMAGYIL